MWGKGLRGSNGTFSTLCQFSVTPSANHNQIGPFWCCFLSGWVCVHSRTLWVSPTTSPVRLGVSPAATSPPTDVFSQWLEALFPHTGTLGCKVCHWVRQLLPCLESSLPGCPSPPLLPVWMNVSSLTPWLSDLHTVRFSVSSGCFLFLNCCPSFGCARRHSLSTYSSIVAGSPILSFNSTLPSMHVYSCLSSHLKGLVI